MRTGWRPGARGLRRAVSRRAAQGLKADGVAVRSVSQPQPTECRRRWAMTAQFWCQGEQERERGQQGLQAGEGVTGSPGHFRPIRQKRGLCGPRPGDNLGLRSAPHPDVVREHV